MDNYQNNNVNQENKNLGILGFVFGLVGFLSCCFYGGVLGFPAIVLCSIEIKKKPNGLAIAGLILGLFAALTVILEIIGVITKNIAPEIIKYFENFTSAN